MGRVSELGVSVTGTACLAIGVGDAPPLDYLRGAVNGAHALAAWATDQGFDTRLLTDETEPVERADVTSALEALLASAPEALILYFGGHGLSRAAGEDLWLLSRWRRDERGVSVNGLRDRLSWHGLKRLILVSDACRSPINVDTQTIEGDSLLGRGPFEDKPPQMDLWYSASRGRAAFMIPGPSPEATRCIFSGLLTEALAGGHAGAFDAEDPQQPITSFSLADFLEAEVPVRATRYGATLNPVITTAIRPPQNRYRDGPPAVPPTFPPWPEPGQAGVAMMGRVDGQQRITPPPGASWTTRSPTGGDRIVPPPQDGSPPPSRTYTSWIVGVGVVVGLIGLPLNRIWGPDVAPPKIDGPTSYLSSIDLPYAVMVIGVVCTALLLIAQLWRFLRWRYAPKYAPPVQAHVPPYSEIPFQEIIALDEFFFEASLGEEQESVNASIASFSAEPRPDRLDTGAAVVLTGATAKKFVAGGHATAASSQGGHVLTVRRSSAGPSPWWTESNRLKNPLPLLIKLSTGDWVGSVAIPHFILSLGIGEGGAQTALFQNVMEPVSEEAQRVMAQLAASGLAGDQTTEVVAALRRGKHRDPMMGVLAAWLHHMQGDRDNILRTAYYFADRGQPIPFDIALLGRLPARRDADGLVQLTVPAVEKSASPRTAPSYMHSATDKAEGVLAGGFPLLRQGWALLDPDGRGDLYPAGLAELNGHLRPAPFTTLDNRGGRKLARLMSKF